MNKNIWFDASNMSNLQNLFRRPGRFSVVGLMNTCLDMAFFWLFIKAIGLPLLFANTFSYSIGIVNSFIWNKYWTFGDVKQKNPTAWQLSLHIISNILGLAISNLLVWLAAYLLPVIVAKLVSIIGTLIWNYLISKCIVYRG